MWSLPPIAIDGDEIWVIETQKEIGTVVNFIEQNIRICESQ